MIELLLRDWPVPTIETKGKFTMSEKHNGSTMPVTPKECPAVCLKQYKDARFLVRGGRIYRNLAADETAPLLARFIPPPNHEKLRT